MMNWRMLYAMLSGAFSGQPAMNLHGRRPTGADMRNPADPVQERRIEAAAAKRARRAEKLAHDVSKAAFCNRAQHGIPFAHTLNPFYVAK